MFEKPLVKEKNDALLINLKDFADVIPSMPTSDNSMHQEMDEDVLSTLFEKFIHLGDDRHFQKVWVAGNLVVNKVAATSPTWWRSRRLRGYDTAGPSRRVGAAAVSLGAGSCSSVARPIEQSRERTVGGEAFHRFLL